MKNLELMGKAYIIQNYLHKNHNFVIACSFLNYASELIVNLIIKVFIYTNTISMNQFSKFIEASPIK